LFAGKSKLSKFHAVFERNALLNLLEMNALLNLFEMNALLNLIYFQEKKGIKICLRVLQSLSMYLNFLLVEAKYIS
jgi:hypothetical protein